MVFTVLSRRIRLSDGSYRLQGQPVPEADNWPAEVRSLRIRQGAIVESDGPEPEAKPAPKRRKRKART